MRCVYIIFHLRDVLYFLWQPDASPLEYELFFKIIRDSINDLKHIDEKLGDWDLVTEYDRQIEDVIIGKLKRAFPDHR